ncbi:MAG: hypothetical protein VYE18_00150 [Pseudomonadota bacterium]|nr:hypothetical protein [Pseudomonadota bacterium]
MAEPSKTRVEADIESLEAGKFTGEEGGLAVSPGKDLAAAVVVAAIGVAAMLLSLELDSPDTVYTAPGLLPFITGISLVVMAVGLATKALKRLPLAEMLAAARDPIGPFLADKEGRRTIYLAGIVFAYVVLTDLISFQIRLPTDFYTFRFSSYETVSIPIIAVVLKIFWRARTWACLAVSAGIVIALASVFRDGFEILLPGSD